MRDDKARTVLATEYSSIPGMGGRARLTETVNEIIRHEYRDILPAIATGQSSCDCRKDLIGGLGNRWGRNRSTIERAVAISTVLNCMNACGLAGYRNHSEFSLSRQLRDVLSSAIMINNDRILANTTAPSMLLATPSTLRG